MGTWRTTIGRIKNGLYYSNWYKPISKSTWLNPYFFRFHTILIQFHYIFFTFLFFLQVTRNHLLNSSNYSLSSLFSVGSVGGSVAGSVASLQGSTRSSIHGPRKKQPSWQGPPCLNTLYQMLLAPFEDLLPASCNNNHGKYDIINLFYPVLYDRL